MSRGSSGNMLTITDIKTTTLVARWGPWKRHWLLVRVDTAEGLQGYGDTSATPQGVRGRLEERHSAVKAEVMGFREMLVGEDPTDVERLHRRMVAGAYARTSSAHLDSGHAVHAASAIETALWDLAGKAAGVPVYKLLGGKHRDRVRLYNCVGSYETYLEMEDVYKEMGTTILKFDVTPSLVSKVPGARMDQHLTRKGLKRMVGAMEQIRDRVDDDIEISVEARTGTVANALRFLREMERFDLTWAEDLIGPTDVDAWATLTRSSTVPTLTGEGLHLRAEFLPYYEKGAARIMSPDFQQCGGLSEGKKICEMADLHHMMVCPHLAASAIGVVAAVHACAAIPNLLSLEFHAMPEWDRILAGYKPAIRGGFIDVPDGPGLGVELDHDEARKYVMEGETYFE